MVIIIQMHQEIHLQALQAIIRIIFQLYNLICKVHYNPKYYQLPLN